MTEQNYYDPNAAAQPQPQQPQPPQPPQPQKKGLPTWLLVTLITVAVLALIIWLTVAAANKAADMLAGLSNNIDAQVASETAGYDQPYLAVLHVEGTMTVAEPDIYSISSGAAYYDHQYLLDSLADLTADEQNRGLLLYIDSPGGEVMAASELGEAIAAYRETTGRPVYAYGYNYAASGGYWVAAPADKFFCNRYCLTGSIGVTYGTMLDFSGFLAEHGIKTNTITSGAQKSMGSSFEEMTPETRAIFQALVDETYGYFLDWVCQQRQMERATLQPLADGRVYTAAQAVALGLADAVGDYQDCLDELTAACGGEVEVREFRPAPENEWSWLMRYFGASGQSNEALLIQQVLPPTGVLAYYEG